MHFFAQAIHAAVAEDRAAEHRVGLAAIERHAEVPGLDALVPVAPDVGDVAVLFGEDHEVRLLPLRVVLFTRVTPLSIRHARARRDAVRAGRATPVQAVVAIDNRHLRAGDGRGTVQTRHEHQGVLRTVLDRHSRGSSPARGTRARAERSASRSGSTRRSRRPSTRGRCLSRRAPSPRRGRVTECDRWSRRASGRRDRPAASSRTPASACEWSASDRRSPGAPPTASPRTGSCA